MEVKAYGQTAENKKGLHTAERADPRGAKTANFESVCRIGGYDGYRISRTVPQTKTGVRHSTKTGYKTVTNLLENDPFGKRKIRSVKISDAKPWLISLQDKGKSYSSIHTIRGVLRPAFQMAADDDL